VDIFWSGSAFDASGRPGSRRTFEFASFNKPTMAAFFHDDSSLAAGHSWRRPQLRSTELSFHDTNSTFLLSPYHQVVSPAFDPQDMVLRFRERADAVKRRGFPPVEGPERQRFIDAANLDFQDFAMLGDAVATLDDGILRLEIDLRPPTS
jgi:hypothetical protein